MAALAMFMCGTAFSYAQAHFRLRHVRRRMKFALLLVLALCTSR
jgi:hypothetical protein